MKPTFFQRRERERYASRRFENPYFRSSKGGGNARRFLAIGAALLIPCGLAGTALYALAAPRFDIAQVAVEGCTSIDPERVRAAVDGALSQRVALFFRRRNAFLFDAVRAEEAIRSAFDLEELSVTQDGDRVLVRLREKTSRLLWRSGEGRYLVGADGTVIRALGGDEAVPQAEPLPAFLDVNRTEVAPGDAVMRPEEVAGAFAFQEALRAIGILFGVTRVDRLSGTWMSVATADGYDILFDPGADALNQADNVRVVLSTQVKDPTKLRYVDVRFGDHVYYK